MQTPNQRIAELGYLKHLLRPYRDYKEVRANIADMDNEIETLKMTHSEVHETIKKHRRAAREALQA